MSVITILVKVALGLSINSSALVESIIDSARRVYIDVPSVEPTYLRMIYSSVCSIIEILLSSCPVIVHLTPFSDSNT